jgi:hypothetical protein
VTVSPIRRDDVREHVASPAVFIHDVQTARYPHHLAGVVFVARRSDQAAHVEHVSVIAVQRSGQS